MTKYITLAVAALVASVAIANAAPEGDMIMAREKATWEAWKSKNEAEFRKLVGPHFVETGPSRIAKLDQSIKRMKADELKSYSISEMSCSFPDPDTAVLTYKAAVVGTADGKPVSQNFTCAAVWRKMGSDWNAVLYSEAPAESDAK